MRKLSDFVAGCNSRRKKNGFSLIFISSLNAKALVGSYASLPSLIAKKLPSHWWVVGVPCETLVSTAGVSAGIQFRPGTKNARIAGLVVPRLPTGSSTAGLSVQHYGINFNKQ